MQSSNHRCVALRDHDLPRAPRESLAVRTRLRVVALLLLVLCAPCGHAQQPLRKVADILALAPGRIGSPEPVQLRGVITRSTAYGFFLQDATAGLWVFKDRPNGLADHDVVELTGTARQGKFAVGVDPIVIRKVGTAPFPRPIVTTVEALSTGNLDSQFVSIRGTVRSLGLREAASPPQKLWVKLATATGPIYIWLPEADLAAARGLIDALVEVHGVAACTKNQDRQIIAPTLMVPGMEGITVLQPALRSLASLPHVPLRSLMQYRSGTDYFHRVVVAGTVTYNKPGESLILEDDGRALYVATTQSAGIEPGDRIEAAGFPAPVNTGPILEDAVLRRLGGGNPLQPRRVTVAELSAGTFNHSLVSVEGRFLRRVDEPYRVVLLIQSGSELLLAKLSGSDHARAFDTLTEGSLVRVTGISMLEQEGTWNMDGPGASVIRYELLIRSVNDVQITRLPSWWTARHVVYLVCIFAMLVLVFVSRDLYGRIAQWKLHAVLHERERMAFEMHDTLAQSLAGIGFQLQAIRRSIPRDHSTLSRQVDVARSLVQHSHAEARRQSEQSLAESGEEIDLLDALRECALGMVAGSSVQVSTVCRGRPRAIAPETAVALLRIGQEAIANAIRHANPDRLDISLHFEEDGVRLVVADNGCGFTKSGALLGFGLRGMRKRAASVSATLEIESQPGLGTLIEAVAPLPPDLSLLLRMKQYWKTFRERVLHVQSG